MEFHIKLFKKNNRNELFVPVGDTLYYQFDPCITIDGQPIKFILNSTEKDGLKAKTFQISWKVDP